MTLCNRAGSTARPIASGLIQKKRTYIRNEDFTMPERVGAARLIEAASGLIGSVFFCNIYQSSECLIRVSMQKKEADALSLNIFFVSSFYLLAGLAFISTLNISI